MKQRIRVVVLLMILAIAGIISFQIYWVVNTYKITEKRFEKDVNDALAEAIETNLLSTLGDDFEEEILGDTTFTYTIESDLDIPEFMKDSSDFISVHMHKSEPRDHIKKDTLSLESVDGKDLMEKGLASLISGIIGMAVEPDYDIDILDSLLNKGLKARDIETEYSLKIHKLSTAQIDSIHHLEEGFTLFQAFSPLNNKEQVLQITFPSRTSLIIKKMWLSLVGSLLLIIIVVGSLLLMLSVIYKQKRLSEMKSDFINNMTHEFKTPIATVSAAIEALTSFNALEDKVKTANYLDLSKTELKRLTTMVEKVLRIAEYEREDISINKDTIEFKSLVDELTSPYLIQKDKNIEIINRIETNALIIADQFHLRTIIGNLIDNSIKYSGDSVKIELELETSEQSSIITVKDNGIGIAKDKQKYIFDKFYRITEGNIYKVKGFGLGLSYVKYLVEKHQGTIQVSSLLNEGTTFKIELPK